jgi:hypothetical protein
MTDETMRPFRQVLDERERRVPFRLLREAYQLAADTVADSPEDPYGVRDYWPACLELTLGAAALTRPEGHVHLSDPDRP